MRKILQERIYLTRIHIPDVQLLFESCLHITPSSSRGGFITNRAGFSLSRALFRKKFGASSPSVSYQLFCSVIPINFLLKNWRPFVVTTEAVIHFTRSLECRLLFPACCYVAKICRSSCGVPCWAEHATCLNLPLITNKIAF